MKTLLSFLFLCSVASSASAASLEHIALEVDDPAAMVKWWTENLGFKVTMSRPAGSTFIADESGRVAFEIYKPDVGRRAPDYWNMSIQQLHFGFFSNDVDADVKRLVAAGATEVVRDDAPGLKGCLLRDPLGIPVQVMDRANPVVGNPPRLEWVTEGFEAFRRGTFGNGGHNLYVSKAGVLQRIYQYDLDRNGYFDLVFANCQNHHESAPSYVYSLDGRRIVTLPAQGARSGLVDDFNGDGIADIVVCGCFDMVTPFASTDIYYGQADGGYDENCHIRIQSPRATDCASGCFDGTGRPGIVFAMPAYGTLRVYPQSELGFEWKNFKDIAMDADLVAMADLDGDGFGDVICRNSLTTSTTVFWGSEQGIDVNVRTDIPEVDRAEVMSVEESAGFTSDLEKKVVAPRLLDVVMWNGQNCFTLSTGKKYIIFSADRSRQITRVLQLPIPLGLSIATGDFNDDGFVDVAIASQARDPNDKSRQNSFIWLNSKDGFKTEGLVRIRTKSACSVSALGNRILFGQCAADGYYTNDALLYSFENGRMCEVPQRLVGEDMRRALIFSDKSGETKALLVNHYSRRSDGFDKTYVYWGRACGYCANDRTEVPSWCAVDSVAADLDDDGWVELLCCNNSENSLDKDPGHFVHHFGPDGFDPSKSYALKTDIGWGAAVADFNRDGYLDIMTVGDHWNSIVFFSGGPDGLRRTKDLVVFPEQPGESAPTANGQGVLDSVSPLKREKAGGLRWPIAVDFNLDGWLDIALPTCGDRSILLWGGPDGYSLERKQEFAVVLSTGVRAADLDGNGYPEIIWGGHSAWLDGTKPNRQPHSSYVHVYWNGQEGMSESRKAILRADAASNLCIGDFDGNGWLDIFAGSYQGEVDRDVNSFIYWNRGGKFSNLDRQDLVTHAVSGCIAADFNLDGRVDIAVANHKILGDHVGDSEVWWNTPEGFVPTRTTKLPTCGPHGMSAVEPGNILTREPNEYYVSEAYLASRDLVVSAAEVVADCPPKTWVKLVARTAPTKGSLSGAKWRDAPGLKVPQGSYLQYRLELGAILSLSTPRITRVTVAF